VADLPFALDPALATRLTAALDREAKIVRVLDELGPLRDRDVALVDGGAVREAQLAARGARVTPVARAPHLAVESESADAVVSLWSSFRGVDTAELAEAERILRPGGRLLAVHDYGRDEVSRLRNPGLPEYGLWSRRDGPFLTAGWKIRVVHAWWTFETLDDAQAFLRDAFGADGAALAATLRRPRLSYNVAIYHRFREVPAA
jgi:SAM-dependent methyltransferase